MKYIFILNHSQQHCIMEMARLLNVSSSAYYSWKKKPRSKRGKENLILIQKIKEIQEEAEYTYGALRITNAIKEQNKTPLGHTRVYKLMKLNNLTVKKKRKRRKSKEEKNLKIEIPNYLNREFNVALPNKVWVSDITYIKTKEKWLYLCAVMDLFSRKIIGWSLSNKMDKRIVIDAYRMALNNRKNPENVMFHSDRGSQYCSKSFRKELTSNNFKQSLSRRGNCWDNACIESFFKSLKQEWIYKDKLNTFYDTKNLVFEYIEVFYNKKRLHSYLDYKSPEQYERLCA